ncbi:MAG: hypothetical protein ACM3N9_02885 [Syntrophothermus sp.]
MHYFNLIIWLLTWPLLIYISYRFCWYLVNRYEKAGMFRPEPMPEEFRE